MEIADGAEDKDLRELALRRVADQALLATAVIEERSHSLSILKHVTDPKELARIARTAKNPEWREKAVARIDDEAVLVEIANTAREPSVRAQAGKRLLPARWKDLLAVLNAKRSEVLAATAPVLAEIACKAIDAEARSAAVLRLADGAVLTKLAERDPSDSVRRDAQQRLTILACEQREAEGRASCEDLRDIGLYYQPEDPRKAIRYLTDVIGRATWLQGISWQERMTLHEARATAYQAMRQYDAAITDFDQAMDECKQPGSESRVLRKRAACYTEMGMEEQAQKDRAALAKLR
jgi:tetratricopeptide (TPR) repeat protein